MSFNIVLLLLYLRFFRNRNRLTAVRNDEIDRVQSECDFYKNEAEKYKMEAEYYKQESYRWKNELDQLKKNRITSHEKEETSISEINHSISEIKEKPEIEDRFNANDFISRLPDLCIIEIFKRLPRKDIFNMSMVSSRFFPLSNEISLDGIKWERGYLEFYKTANGYSFRLSVHIEYSLPGQPYRMPISFKFDYGIIKNENGELIEKKRVGPFDDYDEPSHLYNENGVHSWPVPDILLFNLVHLMRQRNIFDIAFFAFPIEAEFFSKLSKILKGHTVNDITIYHPIINESISEQGRRSFAHFIKDMRKVEIDPSQLLINEEFLREIKGGNLIYFSTCMEMHPMGGNKDGHEEISHYFRPSQSILPYLIGYDVLGVPNMILDRNRLVELCMMAIESLDKTTEKKCELYFAIDREITGYQISLQLRHNYEYELDNREHVIKRVDGKMARISIDNYEVSGQILHGVSVEVHE